MSLDYQNINKIMCAASSPISMMDKRLDGKVALITGGASGIGESTARLFVQHGAKVLIADIQDDLGYSICQKIGPEDAIFYVHCDVTSESDVKAAVDLAVLKYGKLDIMFNNAGISGNVESKILTYEVEDFKRVLEVNLIGAFLGAKHAARVMIPAKKGCILFTSSVCSVTFGSIPHAYLASKHAIVGLAKNLCIELGTYGIRVNSISPYATATPMLTKIMKMEKDKVEDLVCESANLKGTVLEAEDMAKAALYLASDDSKYVSGVNLVIDGGYSLTNPSFKYVIKKLFP